VNVNSDHQETLDAILDHRGGRNIEWRRVRSLLEAVGSVREEHNGKLEVIVGSDRLVLRPPHGKDVDEETLGDIRHLLRNVRT
jgi:hypothetical protein